MSFSDEDLARLKEDLNPLNKNTIVPYMAVTAEDARALIARLEAAERALEMRHVRGVFDTAIEAWRKSTGR